MVIGCGYSSKRDAIDSNSGAKLNEKLAMRRTGSIPTRCSRKIPQSVLASDPKVHSREAILHPDPTGQPQSFRLPKKRVRPVRHADDTMFRLPQAWTIRIGGYC